MNGIFNYPTDSIGCRVRGCTRRHTDRQAMCAAHWRALSDAQRRHILRLYNGGNPRTSYRAAVEDALVAAGEKVVA